MKAIKNHFKGSLEHKIYRFNWILTKIIFLNVFAEDRICLVYAVPDERAHNAAVHLGFHCVQNYSFKSR